MSSEKITMKCEVEIEPSVVFQKVGEEIVFLHAEDGVYYGLDAIGSRMWELLLSHASLAIVLQKMLVEYEVDEAELKNDLLRIVKELNDRKLLRLKSKHG
jgi:hypothetical protein